MNRKKQKGITIIALIITIIVILILTAITVKATVDSGLFKHAKEATTKTNETMKKENEDIKKLGELLDEKIPEPTEPIKPTEEPNISIKINAKTDTTEILRVGEIVPIIITITNNGNVSLNEINILSTLHGSDGILNYTNLDGCILESSRTITKAILNVGETINIAADYIISREDAGSNISFKANVKASFNQNMLSEEAKSQEFRVERLYNLIIHYIYSTGEYAAPSHMAKVLEGEMFSCDSPIIEGYTPDFNFIRSDSSGMPAKDVEITVVYSQNS
jgi:Tfp pilus assembly major pilin PilA